MCVSERDWNISSCAEAGKSPAHRVVDIMYQLPAIMEDADALRQYSDVATVLEKAIALSTKCRNTWAELEQLHCAQELANVHPRYWYASSFLSLTAVASASVGSDSIFPEYICFSDFPTAYAELLYWTSLLLLYSTHCLACIWLREFLGPAFNLLPITDDPFSYPEHHTLYSGACSSATSIAQSLEYFVQPERGGLGVGLIGFPMAVAMGFYEYCHSPKREWFDVVLRYIRETHAIPLDTFLESMFNTDILKLVRV